MEFCFLDGSDLHLVAVEEGFQFGLGGLYSVGVPLEEGVVGVGCTGWLVVVLACWWAGRGGSRWGVLGGCSRRGCCRLRGGGADGLVRGAVAAGPVWVVVAGSSEVSTF